MIDCCSRRHPAALGKAWAGQRVAKTWKTPIEKATEPPPPEYQWLHDIADAAAPEVRRRFIDAIKAIRGTVRETALRAALESGSVDAVMRVLGLDKDLAALEPALLKPLTEAVREAGVAALEATPPLAARGGELAMRFDMVNPGTVQAARTYGFNLIRQISDDTRDGIRAIVANAMEFGGHPSNQAREIRQLIGLTEKQAQAVANFRRMLKESDRTALERELRDRRFDGTLHRTLGQDAIDELTEDQIDRMVGRYAERMLAMRAETIARTETINAARLGTQAAWEQATESGLLNRANLRQGWLVTPDDRLCLFCAEVPLLNPDGVPLGHQFQTALGPVDGPTLHPNCRCALYLLAF